MSNMRDVFETLLHEHEALVRSIVSPEQAEALADSAALLLEAAQAIPPTTKDAQCMVIRAKHEDGAAKAILITAAISGGPVVREKDMRAEVIRLLKHHYRADVGSTTTGLTWEQRFGIEE